MQHCAGSEPRCCRSCSCHSRVRRYLLLHSSGHQSVGSQWALSPADRLEASRKLAGAFSGWRSACARTRAPVGRWDTVLGRHLNPFRMFDECPLSTQFVTWPPNAGRSGSRPAANDPIAEVGRLLRSWRVRRPIAKRPWPKERVPPVSFSNKKTPSSLRP